MGFWSKVMEQERFSEDGAGDGTYANLQQVAVTNHVTPPSHRAAHTPPFVDAVLEYQGKQVEAPSGLVVVIHEVRYSSALHCTLARLYPFVLIPLHEIDDSLAPTIKGTKAKSARAIAMKSFLSAMFKVIFYSNLQQIAVTNHVTPPSHRAAHTPPFVDAVLEYQGKQVEAPSGLVVVIHEVRYSSALHCTLARLYPFVLIPLHENVGIVSVTTLPTAAGIDRRGVILLNSAVPRMLPILKAPFPQVLMKYENTLSLVLALGFTRPKVAGDILKAAAVMGKTRTTSNAAAHTEHG